MNCQMPLCHMASLPDLNRVPSSWPPMSAAVGMTFSVFALEISQSAASTPSASLNVAWVLSALKNEPPFWARTL